MLCSTSSLSPSTSDNCQWLLTTKARAKAAIVVTSSSSSLSLKPPSLAFSPSLLPLHRRRRPFSLQAKKDKEPVPTNSKSLANTDVEEVEEVEEDLPWIQEKALDLVEFTGSLTQAIPGPRVGQSSLPWLLALSLVFVGSTFVAAVVKTVKKFNSPKQKRRNLINKNQTIIKSIDELFKKDREEVQQSALQDIMKKTDSSMEDILRKYIRYALNEKPFNGDMVGDLIQLRKASMMTDSEVAQILNEISRRIVKDKGPVVMDASGYSEKGFKRKLAVQALFGKVFYLSELPEFCSRDSSLIVKEIFGVTDDDADKLRIHTVSDVGDMEALEKMVEDGSDLENSSES